MMIKRRYGTYPGLFGPAGKLLGTKSSRLCSSISDLLRDLRDLTVGIANTYSTHALFQSHLDDDVETYMRCKK